MTIKNKKMLMFNCWLVFFLLITVMLTILVFSFYENSRENFAVQTMASLNKHNTLKMYPKDSDEVGYYHPDKYGQNRPIRIRDWYWLEFSRSDGEAFYTESSSDVIGIGYTFYVDVTVKFCTKKMYNNSGSDNPNDKHYYAVICNGHGAQCQKHDLTEKIVDINSGSTIRENFIEDTDENKLPSHNTNASNKNKNPSNRKYDVKSYSKGTGYQGIKLTVGIGATRVDTAELWNHERVTTLNDELTWNMSSGGVNYETVTIHETNGLVENDIVYIPNTYDNKLVSYPNGYTTYNKLLYNSGNDTSFNASSSSSISSSTIVANQVITIKNQCWTGDSREIGTYVKDTKAPDIKSGLADVLGTGVESLETEREIRSRTVAFGVLNKTNWAIEFGTDSDITKSKESAVCVFIPYTNVNGKIEKGEIETKPYISGTAFYADGEYTLTISDAAGNKSILSWTIMSQLYSENYLILTQNWYLDINSYQIKLPIGYNSNFILPEINSLTGESNTYPQQYNTAQQYLVKTQEQAERVAFELECFQSVEKITGGWLYRSRGSGQGVKYTDKETLIRVVKNAAKGFVQKTPYFGKAELNIEKYFVLDQSLRVNKSDCSELENNAIYLSPQYVFDGKLIDIGLNSAGISTKFYTLERVKLVSRSTGRTFDGLRGQTISSILNNTGGYFTVTELDTAGNSLSYDIYVDIEPPSLEVEIGEVGKDGTSNIVIDGGTINYLYLNTLSVVRILDELDKYVLIDIEGGKISGTYSIDEVPEITSDGKDGEYKMTVYDRTGNTLRFSFYIVGAPPNAVWRENGSDENRILTLSITKGSSYNNIVDIKIYRNDDETPYMQDDLGNDILPNNLVYSFNRGGIYRVIVTDSFGRQTKIKPYKFTKGLPEVTIEGTYDGGITKQAVTLKFSNKFEYLVMLDEQPFDNYKVTNDPTRGRRTLYFAPDDNYNGVYSVKVWSVEDVTNYNIVIFEIDTIAPFLNIKTISGKNVQDGELVTEAIIVEYDNTILTDKLLYKIDGGTSRKYNFGELLGASGQYVFTIRDELFNSRSISVTVDTSVEFKFDGNLIATNELVSGLSADICKGFRILTLEELQIVATDELTGESIVIAADEWFDRDGRYTITLTDRQQNLVVLAIIVDTIAPKIEASELLSNKDITIFILEEEGLTFRLTKDKKDITFVFSNGQIVLSGHGIYKLIVIDFAGNQNEINVQIDDKVDFISSIGNGGYSNSAVTLRANEKLTITVKKDGDSIKYKQGQTFSENGYYEITLVDELGNIATHTFFILSKVVVQSLDMIVNNLPYSVTKNKENYAIIPNNGILHFVEDGDYKVTYAGITFNFTIDTIPPQIKVGNSTIDIENGSIVKGGVYQFDLGDAKDWVIGKDGQIWKNTQCDKPGRYQIIAVDEAGNKAEFIFIIQYKMNVITIIITSLFVLAFFSLIVYLIIKTKKSKRKSTLN